MVAFYIAFMEADIGEPSIEEFTYVYRIKALAKNTQFWYITKRCPDVEGIVGLRDKMGSFKNKYLFYPSKCPSEFRVACTCSFRPSAEFYCISPTFFFLADHRPHPKLKEEELPSIASFNSLSEKQQNFRDLVTITNLRKYEFYHHGAALPRNSRR